MSERKYKTKKKAKDLDTASSSDESSISTLEISGIIDRLKLQNIRKSTRKCYYSTWKTFNEFYIKLDQKPDNWEDRIILFIGYLIDRKRTSQTIKSYLSALKLVLQEDGITLNQDQFLIKSLTKACRYKNDRVRLRLQIHVGILKMLLKTIQQHFDKQGQLYLSIMYQALFATAYYGLFRVSELTSGAHPVKVGDVQIGVNKQKLLFLLRSSKMHSENALPQMVKISSLKRHTESKLFCPYAKLKDFIEIRPKYKIRSEPFFVFRDKSPVTLYHMRMTLKFMLNKCGFNASNYNTQSFRAGRSVDLLRMGIDIWRIQRAGRWTSGAIFRYLKTVELN